MKTGGMKHGSKKGRKTALDVDGRSMVRKLYWSQEFTIRELAVIFKVSRMAIWRYLQEERV